MDLICTFCNRICKNGNSYRVHTSRCKNNPNRIIQKNSNQYIKAKELGIANYGGLSDNGRNRIIERNKNFIWSDEQRLKHSESMNKAVIENPDSYTKNNVCGRVKNILYNGVMLKGSWELKVAVWLDSLSIKWEHEASPHTYMYKERQHLYFPDFYLVEHNVYIEVKGYRTDKDLAKWNSFTKPLIIIDKKIIYNLDNIKRIPELPYWDNKTHRIADKV